MDKYKALPVILNGASLLTFRVWGRLIFAEVVEVVDALGVEFDGAVDVD